MIRNNRRGKRRYHHTVELFSTGESATLEPHRLVRQWSTIQASIISVLGGHQTKPTHRSTSSHPKPYSPRRRYTDGRGLPSECLIQWAWRSRAPSNHQCCLMGRARRGNDNDPAHVPTRKYATLAQHLYSKKAPTQPCTSGETPPVSSRTSPVSPPPSCWHPCTA